MTHSLRIAQFLGALVLVLGTMACTTESSGPPPTAAHVAWPEKPPPYPQPVSPELRAAAVEQETGESDDLSDHCDNPDYWNNLGWGDPGTYVEACGEYPYWLESAAYCDEYGCDPPTDTSGALPGDSCDLTEDGRQVCEGPNGLYYPDSSGNTAHHETSGDAQHQYGCEQGYVPPEEC